ncbi:MAG: type II secretion system protein GspG [Pseudomonadota bacterium]
MTGRSDEVKRSRLPDFLILGAAVVLSVTAAVHWAERTPTTPTEEAWSLEGQRRVREIADAVERYRNDTGSLPNNLEQLVPQYLPALGNDPWGRPFGYEKWRDRAFIRFYGRDGNTKGRGYGVDLDTIAIVWLKERGGVRRASGSNDR